MDYKENITSKLKAMRKLKGYTQQDVANLMQISRSTYSGYENGTIDLSVSSLIELSKIYGIKPEDFFKDNDKLNMYIVYDESLVIDKFEQLNKVYEEKLKQVKDIREVDKEFIIHKFREVIDPFSKMIQDLNYRYILNWEKEK